jgi:hypothetical protein
MFASGLIDAKSLALCDGAASKKGKQSVGTLRPNVRNGANSSLGVICSSIQSMMKNQFQQIMCHARRW